MSKPLKPTRRVELGEMMHPMANALDEWAAGRENGPTNSDRVTAKQARSLAGEIRLCLGQIELTDSMADGEAATKRLQQLRSTALEFLAKNR